MPGSLTNLSIQSMKQWVTSPVSDSTASVSLTPFSIIVTLSSKCTLIYLPLLCSAKWHSIILKLKKIDFTSLTFTNVLLYKIVPTSPNSFGLGLASTSCPVKLISRFRIGMLQNLISTKIPTPQYTLYGKFITEVNDAYERNSSSFFIWNFSTKTCWQNVTCQLLLILQ